MVVWPRIMKRAPNPEKRFAAKLESFMRSANWKTLFSKFVALRRATLHNRLSSKSLTFGRGLRDRVPRHRVGKASRISND